MEDQGDPDDRWINLDGSANTRDVGGLPAAEGVVRRNRLIRSDNLQGLSAADVRRLVDEHQVRAVADLRTTTEVDLEGPGPLTREPLVTIEHLSLIPEAGERTDVIAVEQTGAMARAEAAKRTDAAERTQAAGEHGDRGRPVLLPWQDRDKRKGRRGASESYLGYLDDRPEAIVAALRLIARTAHADGATVVNCAAGKDRTGVVVAMALDEVGVTREAVVEDYVRTGDRLERLLARLKASRTYRDDVQRVPDEQHQPRPETMHKFLATLDERHGGASGWLREHGWTSANAAALRAALLAEKHL